MGVDLWVVCEHAGYRYAPICRRGEADPMRPKKCPMRPRARLSCPARSTCTASTGLWMLAAKWGTRWKKSCISWNLILTVSVVCLGLLK